jgi:hypothetical protein
MWGLPLRPLWRYSEGVTVTLKIHLESVANAEPVWWAESDDVPGLSVAADHLRELVEHAKAAIEELMGPNVEIVQQMVFDAADEPARPSDMQTAPAVPIRQKISTDLLQPA